MFGIFFFVFFFSKPPRPPVCLFVLFFCTCVVCLKLVLSCNASYKSNYSTLLVCYVLMSWRFRPLVAYQYCCCVCCVMYSSTAASYQYHRRDDPYCAYYSTVLLCSIYLISYLLGTWYRLFRLLVPSSPTIRHHHHYYNSTHTQLYHRPASASTLR